MSERLSARHLELASDPALPHSERYRQLAAYHVVSLNFRSAVRAMWASTSGLDRYIPLDDLDPIFREQPAPLWLTSSGEASHYPSSSVETWHDVEGLGESHAEISSMAISPRVKSIHGAAAYVLFGQYGFAVQCLKSSEQGDDVPTLTDFALGIVCVDPPASWIDCWAPEA